MCANHRIGTSEGCKNHKSISVRFPAGRTVAKRAPEPCKCDEKRDPEKYRPNKYYEALLGGKLRALRDETGLSRNKVGRAINKTEMAITNWETGKAMPNAITLAQLLDFYSYMLNRRIHLDEVIGR